MESEGRASSFAKRVKMKRKQYRNWVIMHDVFETSSLSRSQYEGNPYTRMRALYLDKDGFRFRMRRRSFLGRVLSIFGQPTAKTEFSEIDRYFAVKTTDETKMAHLLDSISLRLVMMRQPGLCLEVKTRDSIYGRPLSKGVRELYLQIEGRGLPSELRRSFRAL